MLVNLHPTIRRLKFVVEEQFFPSGNIAHGVNEHFVAERMGFAVGIAAMIDEARIVSIVEAVDQHSVIEMKEVAAGLGCGFEHQFDTRATLAFVLDDASTSMYRILGKEAFTGYGGFADFGEIALKGMIDDDVGHAAKIRISSFECKGWL